MTSNAPLHSSSNTIPTSNILSDSQSDGGCSSELSSPSNQTLPFPIPLANEDRKHASGHMKVTCTSRASNGSSTSSNNRSSTPLLRYPAPPSSLPFLKETHSLRNMRDNHNDSEAITCTLAPLSLDTSPSLCSSSSSWGVSSTLPIVNDDNAKKLEIIPQNGDDDDHHGMACLRLRKEEEGGLPMDASRHIFAHRMGGPSGIHAIDALQCRPSLISTSATNSPPLSEAFCASQSSKENQVYSLQNGASEEGMREYPLFPSTLNVHNSAWDGAKNKNKCELSGLAVETERSTNPAFDVRSSESLPEEKEISLEMVPRKERTSPHLSCPGLHREEEGERLQQKLKRGIIFQKIRPWSTQWTPHQSADSVFPPGGNAILNSVSSSTPNSLVTSTSTTTTSTITKDSSGTSVDYDKNTPSSNEDENIYITDTSSRRPTSSTSSIKSSDGSSHLAKQVIEKKKLVAQTSRWRRKSSGLPRGKHSHDLQEEERARTPLQDPGNNDIGEKGKEYNKNRAVNYSVVSEEEQKTKKKGGGNEIKKEGEKEGARHDVKNVSRTSFPFPSTRSKEGKEKKNQRLQGDNDALSSLSQQFFPIPICRELNTTTVGSPPPSYTSSPLCSFPRPPSGIESCEDAVQRYGDPYTLRVMHHYLEREAVDWERACSYWRKRCYRQCFALHKLWKWQQQQHRQQKEMKAKEKKEEAEGAHKSAGEHVTDESFRYRVEQVRDTVVSTCSAASPTTSCTEWRKSRVRSGSRSRTSPELKSSKDDNPSLRRSTEKDGPPAWPSSSFWRTELDFSSQTKGKTRPLIYGWKTSYSKLGTSPYRHHRGGSRSTDNHSCEDAEGHVSYVAEKNTRQRESLASSRKHYHEASSSPSSYSPSASGELKHHRDLKKEEKIEKEENIVENKVEMERRRETVGKSGPFTPESQVELPPPSRIMQRERMKEENISDSHHLSDDHNCFMNTWLGGSAHTSSTTHTSNTARSCSQRHETGIHKGKVFPSSARKTTGENQERPQSLSRGSTPFSVDSSSSMDALNITLDEAELRNLSKPSVIVCGAAVTSPPSHAGGGGKERVRSASPEDFRSVSIDSEEEKSAKEDDSRQHPSHEDPLHKGISPSETISGESSPWRELSSSSSIQTVRMPPSRIVLPGSLPHFVPYEFRLPRATELTALHSITGKSMNALSRSPGTPYQRKWRKHWEKRIQHLKNLGKKTREHDRGRLPMTLPEMATQLRDIIQQRRARCRRRSCLPTTQLEDYRPFVLAPMRREETEKKGDSENAGNVNSRQRAKHHHYPQPKTRGENANSTDSSSSFSSSSSSKETTPQSHASSTGPPDLSIWNPSGMAVPSSTPVLTDIISPDGAPPPMATTDSGIDVNRNAGKASPSPSPSSGLLPPSKPSSSSRTNTPKSKRREGGKRRSQRVSPLSVSLHLNAGSGCVESKTYVFPSLPLCLQKKDKRHEDLHYPRHGNTKSEKNFHPPYAHTHSYQHHHNCHLHSSIDEKKEDKDVEKEKESAVAMHPPRLDYSMSSFQPRSGIELNSFRSMESGGRSDRNSSPSISPSPYGKQTTHCVTTTSTTTTTMTPIKAQDRLAPTSAGLGEKSAVPPSNLSLLGAFLPKGYTGAHPTFPIHRHSIEQDEMKERKRSADDAQGGMRRWTTNTAGTVSLAEVQYSSSSSKEDNKKQRSALESYCTPPSPHASLFSGDTISCISQAPTSSAAVSTGPLPLYTVDSFPSSTTSFSVPPGLSPLHEPMDSAISSSSSNTNNTTRANTTRTTGWGATARLNRKSNDQTLHSTTRARRRLVTIELNPSIKQLCPEAIEQLESHFLLLKNEEAELTRSSDGNIRMMPGATSVLATHSISPRSHYFSSSSRVPSKEVGKALNAGIKETLYSPSSPVHSVTRLETRRRNRSRSRDRVKCSFDITSPPSTTFSSLLRQHGPDGGGWGGDETSIKTSRRRAIGAPVFMSDSLHLFEDKIPPTDVHIVLRKGIEECSITKRVEEVEEEEEEEEHEIQ